MKTRLVLVTGPPGAGKTTMARRLGPALRLPVIDRDDLKDTMFEELGWSDREWSRRVGAASWELMFLLTERCLAAGTSLLLDSNFRAPADERIAEIIERHPSHIVEVHCSARADVLIDRFRRRWQEGGRHPGHASAEVMEEYSGERFVEMHPALAIEGSLVIEVDTTPPNQVDLDDIVSRIEGEG